MDERFGDSGENLVQRFLNVRKHTDAKEMYQPRVVRDDDEEEGSSSDDM